MTNALNPYQGKLKALEDTMKEMPQSPTRTSHHFSKDCYVRELFIPKHTLLVGKIHKHQTTNILAQGSVSVLTEGQEILRIKAPFVFVSQPGAKRVIFAHEDSTWINAHGTNETDLEKIEDEMIAKEYKEVCSITEEELTELTGGVQCPG